MYVNNCNNDSHPPPPGDGSPQNPGGGGDSAGSGGGGGGGDNSPVTTPETTTCIYYDSDYNNNQITWNRKVDGTCVEVNSSLNIPFFRTEYDVDVLLELFNPGERPVKDELEKERRLINDTIYKSNRTKYYDKTSDTAQTRSFKIHNKSIKVVIGILFSVLIILVIYLVIKLFGLLK